MSLAFESAFPSAKFMGGPSIPFEMDPEGGLLGVPKTGDVIYDVSPGQGRIGVRLSGTDSYNNYVAFINHIIAVIPSNSPERKLARKLLADVADAIAGNRLPSWLTVDELTDAVQRAQKGFDESPVKPEDKKPVEALNSNFNSTSGFNYRAFRLLNRSTLSLPESGVVSGTNGQVMVTDGVLWINTYWNGNDLGFHPDAVMATVMALMGHDERIRGKVQLALLLTDLHAWKIPHYADSPVEQNLDISEALREISTYM
jgi:hypothetical protein